MDFITRLRIKALCRLVGEDAFGNCYYEARKPTHPIYAPARTKLAKGLGKGNNSYAGRRKRYVIFRGMAEASKVPPDWHGWLHYVEDTPPPAEGLPRHAWQKPHQPNLSGTMYAYRPAGHLLGEGKRHKATGDYEAWQPPAHTPMNTKGTTTSDIGDTNDS
ncbi:MAG: NADH:ubiquinone oxidoreductase subunit NDUFA12 [Proteobacteria bacterium]|nr:NADH:ubiquinone oxidoreductase subunit NDUFA12 [Pseudomonadota bacterium]